MIFISWIFLFLLYIIVLDLPYINMRVYMWIFFLHRLLRNFYHECELNFVKYCFSMNWYKNVIFILRLNMINQDIQFSNTEATWHSWNKLETWYWTIILVSYWYIEFADICWRRKWQPTPVFLPGGSQGRQSLVGCHLWGRTESDTTEVT